MVFATRPNITFVCSKTNKNKCVDLFLQTELFFIFLLLIIFSTFVLFTSFFIGYYIFLKILSRVESKNLQGGFRKCIFLPGCFHRVPSSSVCPSCVAWTLPMSCFIVKLFHFIVFFPCSPWANLSVKHFFYRGPRQLFF